MSLDFPVVGDILTPPKNIMGIEVMNKETMNVQSEGYIVGANSSSILELENVDNVVENVIDNVVDAAV